jgi:quinolinate synthase
MVDVLGQRNFEDVNLSKEDLISEINRLCKERNAIILAHYYQEAEIQEIAHFIGDSLQLSQQAAKTDADVIVFAGVHFMAETAKILSPGKTVLLPDTDAGCSLADSCKAVDFERFLVNYPEHTVISYVNTTAEIKALTDIICTSSNALEIVKSLPAKEKIVFAPDKNLGNYINSVSGREMVIWKGACHVHERFSLEKLLRLKGEYTDALIISHPECEKQILLVSDFIGSTSALLKYVSDDKHSTFIVCTESGILHQMQKKCPEKVFVPAPPNDSTCACNDCQFMKLTDLKKVYLSLARNRFEINLDENIRLKAEKPIRRMLELSEKLGIK